MKIYCDLDLAVNSSYPGDFITLDGEDIMLGHEMHEGYIEMFEEWEYEV